jgi:hypothetical protein
VAFTKSFEAITNFGTKALFPDTYIRVQIITGNKESLESSINFYTKRDGQLIKTEYVNFVPKLDGDNFIKQAYLHLKTLPEFADAIDC